MKNLNKIYNAEDLQLKDAEVFYYRTFLNKKEADNFYAQLLKTIEWQQHEVKIFGKILPQPRLSALFSETEKHYTYSGLTLHPLKFPPLLQELQKKLKLITGKHFTHCLANLYRTGQDSMGLHSDDERELGKNPVIASISLGGNRKFRLRHKTDKTLRYEMELDNGSLLLMQGSTQHFWKHEIPKTTKKVFPRINLTYRIIQ